MKVAHFTVHATAEQSARWKRAAEADGHRAVGSWLSEAADCFLKARARAGRPIPLGWRKGRFLAPLSTGAIDVFGMVSRPFGYYRGTDARADRYNDFYTLVHLSSGSLIATLRSAGQCRALAAEIAPVLIRGDVSGIIERHTREAK